MGKVDQKIKTLKKLERISEEKGEKLQSAIFDQAYMLAAEYETREEMPDVVFNAILMLNEISEQLYFYNIFLGLFINSHLEDFKDKSNKKVFYYFLTFRSPVGRIHNYKEQIFSNYDRIDNKTVLKKLDEAEKTITSIIEYLNDCENKLKNNFGSPCDYLENETAFRLPQKITLDSSHVKREMRHFSAKLRPHFSNGQTDGVVVSNIQPESLFHQMELKDGDIILDYNGKPIKSFEDSFKLYKILETASSFKLKIKRGSDTATTQYSFE